MSSVQVQRLWLFQDGIIMKQVEAFLNMEGIGIEYVAARQWYADVYNASREATDLIKPLAAKAKSAQEAVNTAWVKAKKKLEDIAKEDADALNTVIMAQVSVNVVTLHVKAKWEKLSLAQYLQLEQLHELKLINCDLFEPKK